MSTSVSLRLRSWRSAWRTACAPSEATSKERSAAPRRPRKTKTTQQVANQQRQPAEAVDEPAVAEDSKSLVYGEVELKEDDDALTAEESDALWAPVRKKLQREGSIMNEDGEELISMEEVERRLHAAVRPAVRRGDEIDDLEDDELGDEDEQDDVEEDDEAEDEDGSSSPSTSYSSASRHRSFSSNTLWVQERSDGSVSIEPWPYSSSDPLPDLDSSYDLNMPSKAASSPSSNPSAIIGQSIGGEKLSAGDVAVLLERDLLEHFTKGGGKGGQKVNKTSNCVHLQHVPTGTIVKCHATRSLSDNRRIARTIMQARLDELLMGPNSSNQQRRRKIQKSKAKSRKRTAAKYGHEKEQQRVDELTLVEEEECTLPSAPRAVLAAQKTGASRSPSSSTAGSRPVQSAGTK